jgi:glucose-1-phosphate adenylyltransferase
MSGKNTLGIIYSNAYDEVLSEMTGLRTMGSVPFAGRYRLIDFALSTMVNSGITKVGVITKSNYQSLMDHLGTGKPWDLSRKTEGMYILPPFSLFGRNTSGNKLQSIKGISSFISQSNEDYVLLSDCNVVWNMDVDEILDFHKANNADITIVYQNGIAPSLENLMVFDMDGNTVKDITFNPPKDEKVNYSANIIFLSKQLLERLINDAVSQNYDSLERDLFKGYVSRLKICGFEAKGFVRMIDSMLSYYSVSMELLNVKNRNELFDKERPIYTKVRDDMPAIYGLGSSVKGSLISSGCIIDGEVENSILFRGVRVEKGAVIKNSIIMQDSFIGTGSSLNCVVLDKKVAITPHKHLSGDASYPVYVGKGIII